ncbi:MFS transporter [Lichenicoccus roseus]|uniref:MFS transporter n=1 Tax=Lichenicoccus roseus TaxID=2683649 RepID=A0A5R9J1P1_9PROT|nr:MFS transporter [Lichenicoccus roseus]TLU71560.1 MFS transporter [Lichenicoccus roseus]
MIPIPSVPGGARGRTELDRVLARRLLPLLVVAYIICFLDRTNIAIAKSHLQVDLGISAAVYGIGAGLFFLTYALFEVPSNLIMHRVGARVWITRIMITWGIVSGCMALVQGEKSFYALRMLLGIAESGFFPGVMLYLTYWFRPEQRARASGLFLLGVAAANALGSPVSGALLELDGVAGLHGWQWLFIVEAIPALLMASLVWRLLPDGPRSAPWLSPREAELVVEETGKGGSEHHRLDLRAVVAPQILLTIVIYFFHQIAIYCVTFFLPGIIGTYGKMSSFSVGLLTSLPWISAALGTVLMLRSDVDVKRSRRLMVIGLLVMAGGLGMASLRDPVIAMVGFCIASSMFFVAEGILFTYPASWLSGSSLAAGIAFVNSCGLVGGFVGPSLMGLIEQHTGRAANGLLAVAAVLVLAAILSLWLRQKGEVEEVAAVPRPASS